MRDCYSIGFYNINFSALFKYFLVQNMFRKLRVLSVISYFLLIWIDSLINLLLALCFFFKYS